MPFKDVLENCLGTALDNIAVAGDNPLEVPGVDLPDALVETPPVLGASSIPEESFLPQCRALCAH